MKNNEISNTFIKPTWLLYIYGPAVLFVLLNLVCVSCRDPGLMERVTVRRKRFALQSLLSNAHRRMKRLVKEGGSGTSKSEVFAPLVLCIVVNVGSLFKIMIICK